MISSSKMKKNFGYMGRLREKRIMKDIKEFVDSPAHGIFYSMNESNMNEGAAMIIGPSGTPYEGGFYHIAVKLPENYPYEFPSMKFQTVEQTGTVRIHPNLYSDGNICISIINTWDGESWTPSQSIMSVLLTLQSLLDEKPLMHEPGAKKSPDNIDSYNICVTHENIRVAVLHMMEKCPHSKFLETMEKYFCDHIEDYLEICRKNFHHDGQRVHAPFYDKFRIVCDFKKLYRSLLERYNLIATKYHTHDQILKVKRNEIDDVKIRIKIKIKDTSSLH